MIKVVHPGVLEVRHRYLKVAALNIPLGIGLQKTKMIPTACFREKQSGTGDVD